MTRMAGTMAGRKVKVIITLEKSEEDFDSEDYFDYDSSRFDHITNGDWPPNKLEHMVKIDEIDDHLILTELELNAGYDRTSVTWSIE